MKIPAKNNKFFVSHFIEWKRSVLQRSWLVVIRAFSLQSVVEKLLFTVFIALCAVLSNHLWQGDILFHTDLARDFLVLQEMVETKNPTLIGPRSGGIPGVFHGPLWYYMSLVPFIFFHGDPVLMGWFWWGLAVLSSLVFYVVLFWQTRKRVPSLVATLVFAVFALVSAVSPVNNYLADLFGFVSFILAWLWWRKSSLALAILGWFSLGVLVQFQMAFAAPIAIIWGVIFLARVIQKKQYAHLLSILFFFPPLASFFLFDIRHDWLQVRSVLAYVSAPSEDSAFSLRILNRLDLLSEAALNVFLLPKYFSGLVFVIFAWLGWNTKKASVHSLIGLFLAWYLGFWVLTLAFSGVVWGYYFSPFVGILLSVIGYIAAKSRMAMGLLVVLCAFFLLQNLKYITHSEDRFSGSSWKLLRSIAQESLSEPEVGYFLYSQDQFAYSLKYAFSRHTKTYPESDFGPFEKRSKVVIIKSPDDPRNPFLTSESWQRDAIRIQSEPYETKQFPQGYVMERYELTPEHIAVPIDPNLILDLHFR
jgi:hypothetical protein